MSEMSCHRSAEILGECIGKVALQRGERWTAPLVTKVSALNGMRYWDSEDLRRFEPDYAFLESALRQ
jgi:hypothetical protein